MRDHMQEINKRLRKQEEEILANDKKTLEICSEKWDKWK